MKDVDLEFLRGLIEAIDDSGLDHARSGWDPGSHFPDAGDCR